MVMSPRETLFANAYASGKSKKESVIAAGLDPANASKHSKKFLSNAEIVEYIAQIRSEARMLALVDTTKVLSRLAAIAFLDSKEIWNIAQNPNGEWSAHARAAISSVAVTKAYRNYEGDDTIVEVKTEVKARDTLRALKMLGDHSGSFTGLNSLLSGLKSYGIEIERVDGKYVILQDDSDPAKART